MKNKVKDEGVGDYGGEGSEEKSKEVSGGDGKK
jgi:hypothetical protein